MTPRPLVAAGTMVAAPPPPQQQAAEHGARVRARLLGATTRRGARWRGGGTRRLSTQSGRTRHVIPTEIAPHKPHPIHATIITQSSTQSPPSGRPGAPLRPRTLRQTVRGLRRGHVRRGAARHRGAAGKISINFNHSQRRRELRLRVALSPADFISETTANVVTFRRPLNSGATRRLLTQCCATALISFSPLNPRRRRLFYLLRFAARVRSRGNSIRGRLQFRPGHAGGPRAHPPVPGARTHLPTQFHPCTHGCAVLSTGVVIISVRAIIHRGFSIRARHNNRQTRSSCSLRLRATGAWTRTGRTRRGYTDSLCRYGYGYG